MKIAMLKASPSGSPPLVSPRLVKMFAAYANRYVRRRFHAIRILKTGMPPRDVSLPLVIYINHAAWWDPLICLHLAQRYFTDRTSYAPIDAAALQRYSFFKRLGFFGIEQKSMRAATKFLRTAAAILTSPRNILWLTPQGCFTDVRERPLRLEHGIGELAARLENVLFLPLAIEYTFWTEPRPEILLSFGEPTISHNAAPLSAPDCTKVFGTALEEVQDELATRSCRRDPNEWIVLERGTSGVNPFYDTWRRVRAYVGGKKFAPDHHVEELR